MSKFPHRMLTIKGIILSKLLLWFTHTQHWSGEALTICVSMPLYTYILLFIIRTQNKFTFSIKYDIFVVKNHPFIWRGWKTIEDTCSHLTWILLIMTLVPSPLDHSNCPRCLQIYDLGFSHKFLFSFF